MKKSIKAKILSTLLISALALRITGCTNSSATVVEKITANKSEITAAYVGTAFVNVSSKTKASSSANTAPKTSTGENGTENDIDIINCGALNTVNANYEMPSLTGPEDVNYFSPVIGNEDILDVSFKEALEGMEKTENEKVSIVNVNLNNTETTAYRINEPGIYTLKLQSGNVDFKVTEGSMLDDAFNGNEMPSNMWVNTNSKEFKELLADYEANLPLLIENYLNGAADRTEALKTFKSEKANELKEYNRLRVLMGEKPLDVEEIANAFGTEEKVEAAKSSETASKRGLKASQNTSTNETKANASKDAFDQINAIRKQNGLSTLKWSNSAYNIAAKRAIEITSNFSHNTNLYVEGENIGKSTSSSATNMVNSWMASASHKKNILNGNYGSGAIAVAEANGTFYFVNVFYLDTNDKNIETQASGGTVERQTSDGKTYTTTTKKDENGNTVIQMGPKVDADGWTDAHFVLEKCYTEVGDEKLNCVKTVGYDDVKHSFDELPNLNGERVTLNYRVQSDVGCYGGTGYQFKIIYRDGRIEYQKPASYLGSKTNFDLSTMLNQKVKISTVHSRPGWKFADE